ncbi:hypothetical protein BFP97_06455 [Roseivirga sp. 4D4]|nr:hypothetical protein BFP97_06455 [Roseivirga sp. 4D4]
MSPRRKLIDLKSYGQTGKDLDAFRVELSLRLMPLIFSFESIKELQYEALKHIKPINKSLQNNPSSIHKGITKVVDHFFGNRKKVQVHRINSDGTMTPVGKKHDEQEDSEEMFQRWVSGFSQIPNHHLNYLKPQVEEDLKEINKLIKFYEGLEEVKDFLVTRKVRPFHDTRTILDFYSRCQEERQKILDYYLEGVYERAIAKSRAHIFPGLGLQSLDFWKDYPYELGRHPYGRALDYREIDHVSHRLSEVPVRFNGELKILYQENKEQFYKEYFKLRPLEKIFEGMCSNFEYLPMTNNRSHIFEELRAVFKKKQWLAFYALALPQVEGVFAEMVKSANPRSGVITKALSDKVRSVRPDYELSDVYFDYYEYELPKQRNSFSHTGVVQNAKLKAYDTLIDLEHILSVYASLENPLVAIHKTLRNRNLKDFTDFKGFAKYFNLLNALPKEHKSKPDLKIALDNFNQNFLREACSIEGIVRNAEANIDFGFSDLWSRCKSSIPEFQNIVSWRAINKPKLQKLLLEEKFKENSKDFFQFNDEEVSIAISMKIFFYGVENHIYKGHRPDELKRAFQTWEDNKSFVKWLIDFKSLIPELLD